jgi:Lipopolysaccharide-assembly
MKKKTLVFSISSFLFLLSGCANKPDVIYRPYPQILPSHVKKIAVRQFMNKVQYFGLEDKLTLKVIDEFLSDGTYPVVPESKADGVIVGEIRRYILTPIQYNTALVPTVYKLDVLLMVKFYDKATNTYLWEEPALQGTKIFAAATMPEGISEEEAREYVWEMLAKDIVKRTVDGFGAVQSEREKKIAPTDPNTDKLTDEQKTY